MRLLALWLLALPALAAELPLRPQRVARYEPGTVLGAALLRPGALLTWGPEVREWNLRRGSHRVLVRDAALAQGGCVADVNRDGQPDLIAQEGAGLGRMVLRLSPGWGRTEIDRETDFRDCLATTLFGRAGVLVLHRYSQLRFYEFPPRPAQEPWPAHDLYSIYTPSRQGGLARADVDGDARLDILCGNYWVRSPERFELPWRLFAINTYTEAADSGLLSLAPLRPGLLAVTEGGLPEGRLSLFTRPDDARQLWREEVLVRGLRHARGLVALDAGTLVAGEGTGESPKLLLLRKGARGWQERREAMEDGVLLLVRLPGRRVLAVGRRGLVMWRVGGVVEERGW